MNISVLTTKNDVFWETQNQKLLAQAAFVKGSGTFFDDVHCFKKSNGFITSLDFSVFDLEHVKIENVARLNLDGQVYPLSTKDYAKLFVLSNLPTKGSDGALETYSMLFHLFMFLNSKQVSTISLNVLEDFWISLLTQSVNENGFYSRLSPPSYRSAIQPILFPKIKRSLHLLGVEGLIDQSLSQKKIDIALDEVCQSQLNISLAEYKIGGSFNFLGLELGQYYIDYLRQVYSQDYLYTVICKQAISQIRQKYGISAMESRSGNQLNQLLLQCLTGVKAEEAELHRVTRGISHEVIHSEIQTRLFEQYQEHFESVLSLNEKCIEELVLKLSLESRFDAVEVIRVIMLQKFYGLNTHKTAKQVWDSYLCSLDKTFLESEKLKDIDVDDVYAKMQQIVLLKKSSRNKFLDEFFSWGKGVLENCVHSNYKSFKSELNRSIHAMTSLFVAYTGYRVSEYGFPLSAIHTEPNLDIFDSSHVPCRFKLKWLVPKTNGQTKINREITSQCYQIAVQLSRFFSTSEDAPCLYESGKDSITHRVSSKSERYIANRVKSNWEGFVYRYSPFIDALTLNTLIEKDVAILSMQERKELERLKHCYNLSGSKYKHLLDTAMSVRREWKILRWTHIGRIVDQKALKESLIAFSHSGKAMMPEHQELIESHLSNETKKWLLTENVVLDKKAMHDIGSELLQDVRYPTAHAFRHIWAEAVLTRYEGNVGAVIRHQFCHLDSSFFMAYLRNKDARLILKGARQRYLNSIVEQLLIDSDKIGQEYLGGFSRYVKKCLNLTKPVNDTEMRELKDRIKGRVISIQPSNFAICVPREGAERRVKCAKFGSINSQDAKPSFCLNCTNALITSGNLRGIWQTIEPIVKESFKEMAMGFMLESHLPTLRSGYKRIKELKPAVKNQESVSKILDAIESSIKSIEDKLEKEKLIYG